MQIHHIALYVQDLERAKTFYTKYFNGLANEKYYNPKTGLQTYFIAFSNGCKLELMTRPETAQTSILPYSCGWAHLSFTVGSKADVDRLAETLVNDGYTLFSPARTTGDGYYEACILDPEGNQVEIMAG